MLLALQSRELLRDGRPSGGAFRSVGGPLPLSQLRRIAARDYLRVYPYPHVLELRGWFHPEASERYLHLAISL